MERVDLLGAGGNEMPGEESQPLDGSVDPWGVSGDVSSAASAVGSEGAAGSGEREFAPVGLSSFSSLSLLHRSSVLSRCLRFRRSTR